MPSPTRTMLCAVALAAGSWACDGDDGDEDDDVGPLPEVDCDAVTVPTFNQVTAFYSICTNCHSRDKMGADRNDAPTDVDFDDYASAEDHARLAASMVFQGFMPPASETQPDQAQKDQIYAWALCGTPR